MHQAGLCKRRQRCFLFYFFQESSVHEFWTTAVVTLAELSDFYRRLFTGWMVTCLNKLTETGGGSVEGASRERNLLPWLGSRVHRKEKFYAFAMNDRETE